MDKRQTFFSPKSHAICQQINLFAHDDQNQKIKATSDLSSKVESNSLIVFDTFENNTSLMKDEIVLTNSTINRERHKKYSM